MERVVSGRVADVDDVPLPASVFQGVGHHHSAVYIRVTLLMERDGCIGLVTLKSHGRGGHAQTIHVETGVRLQTLQNCVLNLFFVVYIAAATSEQKDCRRYRGRYA
jgi:hypothetical protein